MLRISRLICVMGNSLTREPEHLLSVWSELNPENIILHLDSIEDTEGLQISLSATTSPFQFVQNKKVIFAFSQTTDINAFEPWYELGFRHVQIMNIDHIGKQGEQFDNHTFEIIENLQKKYKDIIIQVDGGVTLENVGKLTKAGVESAAVGSAVFKNNTVSENISELQKGAIL